MAKPEKYKKYRFELEECKGHINLVSKTDEENYLVAYLNIQLPDGRWAVFTMDENCRIPLFKEEEDS